MCGRFGIRPVATSRASTISSLHSSRFSFPLTYISAAFLIRSQNRARLTSGWIADDPETYDVSALPPGVLESLEADSFWCLSKLLDGIQDNYIFAQPGIVRQVARMRELCSRVDGRCRLFRISKFFLLRARLKHHSHIISKRTTSSSCSSPSAGSTAFSCEK